MVHLLKNGGEIKIMMQIIKDLEPYEKVVIGIAGVFCLLLFFLVILNWIGSF